MDVDDLAILYSSKEWKKLEKTNTQDMIAAYLSNCLGQMLTASIELLVLSQHLVLSSKTITEQLFPGMLDAWDIAK